MVTNRSMKRRRGASTDRGHTQIGRRRESKRSLSAGLTWHMGEKRGTTLIFTCGSKLKTEMCFGSGTPFAI